MSKIPNGPHGFSFWGSICKELEAFSQAISFLVQRGTRVKFWSNAWCGHESLKDMFPNIYNLAILKEGTVRQHMGEHEGHEGWDLKLRRNLNDREMKEVTTLLRKLENVHVGSVFEEDKRV